VLRRAGLREQVMVDCSHANSAKQHRRQIEVAADMAAQVGGGENRIIGAMVESHLHEGRQNLVAGQALAPGVSITDACIGWVDTEPLLRSLAEAVRARRAR
jgi:3-deoxy-7-phosphoheptulonate synthase